MTTPPEDLIACHVLATMARDHRDGRLRSLRDYQELQPRFSGLIAAEWRATFDHGAVDEPLDSLTARCHALPAGSVFAGMDVREAIGHGGQGEVYRAFDRRLQRDVAIKVLHRLGSLSPEHRERLAREGRLAARLDHPGICRVLASGVEDDLPYLVFDFVAGETLAAWLAALRRDPACAASVSVAERVTIVRDLASALAYAHRAGIVHRDLKPGNVMRTTLGEPVILDFGLGRADQELSITVSGDIVGTVGYMAPERYEPGSERAGAPAVDVFAVGVILHELLAPDAPLPKPRNGDRDEFGAAIPLRLRPILSRCLQADPNRRFVDASEVHVALEGFLAGAPVAGLRRFVGAQLLARLRRPLQVAAASVAAIAVALLVWQLSERARHDDGRRRITAVTLAARSLGDGDLDVAADALMQIAPDGSDVVARLLQAAVDTERAQRPPKNGGAAEGQKELAVALARVVRVSGRSGVDVEIVRAAGPWPSRRLAFAGRDVDAFALSQDALRLGVIVHPLGVDARAFELWSLADGSLLERVALGAERVTAVGELTDGAWLLGDDRGRVELLADGARHFARRISTEAIAEVLDHGDGDGAWVVDARGTRSWFSARVRSGALCVPLRVPVRQLRFVSEGRLEALTSAGWTAVIDVDRGDVVALQRADPLAAATRTAGTEGAPHVSLGKAATAVLHADRVELRDVARTGREEGPAPAIALHGGLTCVAYEDATTALAIGSDDGLVYVYRAAGWPALDATRIAPDWRLAAARAGYLPLTTIAPNALDALPCLPRSAAPVRAPLGVSNVVPHLPRAWYEHQRVRCRDALAAFPDDHGFAVRLAVAELRCGDLDAVERQLTRPPLLDSPAPSAALLRALLRSRRDPSADLQAFVDAIDADVARQGGVAGPLVTWLRLEAAAVRGDADQQAWNWLATAIGDGLEDSASWHRHRRELPAATDVRRRLEQLLRHAESAASLLVNDCLDVLAAADVDPQLHQAAASIVDLAASMLAARSDDGTCARALACLRRGRTADAVTLLATLEPRVAGARLDRIQSLVVAVTKAHVNDLVGAAAAYNAALVARSSSWDGGLASALLEREAAGLLSVR